jgi:hypothetical protein
MNFPYGLLNFPKLHGLYYWHRISNKHQLGGENMNRFRNALLGAAAAILIIQTLLFTAPGQLLAGQVSNVSTRSVAGSTTPGSTNWQPYAGNTGVYLNVDTSAGKFTTTPTYFTSLGGNSSHWATTGVTSIYNATPTGFRVFVRWSDGSALTPAQANAFQWHVNWLGVESNQRL